MKNGDVRGACLALIRNRVGGATSARTPRPAALGMRLERGDVPAGELAALCAAVIGTLPPPHGTAAGARRWQPSEALSAMLGEYHRVQTGAERTPRPGINGYAAADAAHGH